MPRAARSFEPTTESAIIYIRVSSERQVSNASLETQQRACEELCARNGWEVLRVFREEGESAKTTNRTQFQNALEFCRKGLPRPRYFVVYHTDRFARSAADHSTVRLTLKQWGILLRSASQQLGEDKMDKFIELIWAGQAELDNDIRKEKTVGGMTTRLKQGRWTFKAPLGYQNIKQGGEKTIIPDPDRAELIRAAFDRYASGLYKRNEVLAWVTDQGLRTGEGKRISAETFRRILNNPLYAGRIVVRGKEDGAGVDWDIHEEGDFEAIISGEVYDRVQALLAGRGLTVAPRLRANPEFPLRGFVMCGTCGSPLTGSNSTGRSGSRYPYYHCQNKKCLNQIRVAKPKMEAEFFDFIAQLTPDPQYLTVFRKSVIEVYQAKFAESLDSRETLERELRKKKESKRKLNDAYIYRNAISDEDYKQMKGELEQETLELEMKISDVRQEGMEIEEVLDFSVRILMNAAEMWKEADLGQKQRLQQILYPQKVSYLNGLYRTDATSPLFNMLQEKNHEEEDMVALTGIEPVF